MTVPQLTLNDGVTIPQLGFGVWQVGSDEVVPAVAKALEVGYRHIDTAAAYKNEDGVGKAFAESGLARDEVFITTKLANPDHGDPRGAIERSLEQLGLDHVDLYLIHWPATIKYGDSYIDCWDAMQEFKAEGLVRSIGVSNFHAHHLDALNGAVPSMNQIELHPSFNQAELRRVLDDRGITTEAWSPLGNAAWGGVGSKPSDLDLDVIKQVATETGKSPAQVVIRWHLQLGNVVIPKSVTPKRIEENFDVLDFELSQAQMDAINNCPQAERQGGNPDTAEF